MDRNEIKAIIENILFVSDAPVTVKKLVALFEEKLADDELKRIMAELEGDYASGALRISEVAEGWRMTTNQEYAQWITNFFKMEKGHKLTRASLETLAIIAYRQPITRAEVDDIRGVDSGGVLRGLIDKSMVKTMGRRKVPGRPMMYGTTNRFLEFFGLARLADLPTLDEFQAELGGEMTGRTRQAMIDFVPDETNPDDDAGGLDEADNNTDIMEEEGQNEVLNNTEGLNETGGLNNTEGLNETENLAETEDIAETEDLA